MKLSEHEQISPTGSWKKIPKRSFWSRRNRRKGTRARRLRSFWSICFRLLRSVSPLLFVAGLFLTTQHTWRLLTTSKFFGMKIFDYVGDPSLPEDALRRYLGVQFGDNLLSMNLRKMANKIKAHPRVKSVRLQRNFPDTLKVRVSTYASVAVIHLEKPYLVNQYGVPFSPLLRKREGAGLLQLRGFEQYSREARDGRLKKMILQTLALHNRYKSLQLSAYKPLEEIEYNALLGYILRSGDARVHIGDDRLERRLINLKKVFALFQQKGIRSFNYIYLNSKRYPDRVTVRLQDSVAIKSPAE